MLSNLDADAPSLRRTGNVAVVFGLQPSEACRMRGVFQTVDTDGSGGLDLGEFTTAMQILCPSLSAEDCGIVFKAVDINGDGQISYTEFLGASPPLPLRLYLWLRPSHPTAHALHPRNVLSPPHPAPHSSAASLDPRCVDIAELNKAFHLLDANGDGLISAPELQALYHLKLSQSLRVPGLGQGQGGGAAATAGAEEEKGIFDDAPADWGQARLASPPALSPSSASSTGAEAGAEGQEALLSPRSSAVRDYLGNIALVNQRASESIRDVSFSILEMMAACDKDKDGFISYEEFIWGMTGSWIKEVLSDEVIEKTKTGDLALLRGAPSQSDLLVASGISRESQSVRGSRQQSGEHRSLPHTPTPPFPDKDKDKEPPFPPSSDACMDPIIGSLVEGEEEGEEEEEAKCTTSPSAMALAQ
jgi:Ca2+-binding EF-hand superfamily protein